MLWLLIVVSLHGNVSILTGFRTQDVCERVRIELPKGNYKSQCIVVSNNDVLSHIDW